MPGNPQEAHGFLPSAAEAFAAACIEVPPLREKTRPELFFTFGDIAGRYRRSGTPNLPGIASVFGRC